MYIPSAFKIEDEEKIARFIEQNSFATVITEVGDCSFASHLPLLFDAPTSLSFAVSWVAKGSDGNSAKYRGHILPFVFPVRHNLAFLKHQRTG